MTCPIAVSMQALYPTFRQLMGFGHDIHTGWTDFRMHASARAVYFGVGGSDANTGLSWAQRKATPSGARAALRANMGDWCIGGAGESFTGSYGALVAGLNQYYPTMFTCCDTTDPENPAKWGLGWVTIGTSDTGASEPVGTFSNKAYTAFRGVHYAPTTVANRRWWHTGEYTHYERFRSERTSFQFRGAITTEVNTDWQRYFTMRNSSVAWSSGVADGDRFSNVYTERTRYARFERVLNYHGGWAQSTTRETSTTASPDGPSVYKHGFYIPSANEATELVECIAAYPSAAAYKLHGHNSKMNRCVQYRSPSGSARGGGSAHNLQWPAGQYTETTDLTAIFTDDVRVPPANTYSRAGNLIGMESNLPGSYIRGTVGLNGVTSYAPPYNALVYSVSSFLNINHTGIICDGIVSDWPMYSTNNPIAQGISGSGTITQTYRDLAVPFASSGDRHVDSRTLTVPTKTIDTFMTVLLVPDKPTLVGATDKDREIEFFEWAITRPELPWANWLSRHFRAQVKR